MTSLIVDTLDAHFARWGVQDAITTDNGPQFLSEDFESYRADKGICHIHTAFYNPQANGGVERLNQTLKNGIRAHMAQGCTFTNSLLQTLLQYRASQYSTTEVSPASLMLGQELQLPLHKLRPPQLQLTVAAASATVAIQHWVGIKRPHRNNKLQSFWSPLLQISWTRLHFSSWMACAGMQTTSVE